MLTVKCKEDFVKWFGEDDDYNMDLESNLSGYNPVTGFKDLPFSMQFGVYVDFFDSVGIEISITPKGSEWDFNITDGRLKGHLLFSEYDFSSTRHEARQKAIDKANEIYNQNQGQ